MMEGQAPKCSPRFQCLFGGILERMKNLEVKSGEKEVLVGVWLRGGEETNVVRPEHFLPSPTKKFFLQNWGKGVGSLICLIDKNAHVYLHMDFIQLPFFFVPFQF